MVKMIIEVAAIVTTVLLVFYLFIASISGYLSKPDQKPECPNVERTLIIRHHLATGEITPMEL